MDARGYQARDACRISIRSRLTLEQRREYSYDGPEIIYTFWAKHGPCQVTGCGHRTPIMTSPVMAIKTLTVKHWEHTCGKCGSDFHVEENNARMAPDVPLYVAPDEYPFSILDPKRGVVCPHCGHAAMVKLGKGKNKKVEMSLLVHPQWLAGSPKNDENGQPFGGSAQDDAASSARWNQERAHKIRLLEGKRGAAGFGNMPRNESNIQYRKEGGTVPKKSKLCMRRVRHGAGCSTTVKATGKTGPMAGYAVQGYSPKSADKGDAYNGRFCAPYDEKLAAQYDAARKEWDERKDADLSAILAQERIAVCVHDASPARRRSESWLHALVDYVQSPAIAGSYPVAEGHRHLGNYSWESREYRSWGIPTVSAEIKAYSHSGMSKPTSLSRCFEQQLSSKIDSN